MNQTVLIATVGGSHQPIMTAIKEAKPDYICFLCTDKDGATGKPGSREQIEGKGKVIKSDSKMDQPDLPNIPTQLQLKPENYQVRLVASDDLDDVVHHAQNAHGKRQAGLRSAWQLVAEFVDGTAKDFALSQADVMLNHVKIRNHSILAHGFAPISEKEWSAFYHWLDQHLKPLLLEEAKLIGIKGFAPQLPDRLTRCMDNHND